MRPATGRTSASWRFTSASASCTCCWDNRTGRAMSSSEAEPENVNAQLSLALACTNLGDARMEQNQQAEAGAAYNRALALYLRCAAAQPASPTIRSNLALIHVRIGSLAIRRREPHAAE